MEVKMEGREILRGEVNIIQDLQVNVFVVDMETTMQKTQNVPQGRKRARSAEKLDISRPNAGVNQEQFLMVSYQQNQSKAVKVSEV